MSWWQRLFGKSGGAAAPTRGERLMSSEAAGASVPESLECPACGESVEEGWECGTCRRVFCEDCGGEAESQASLSQQQVAGLGNVMLVDLTEPDKGPACGRCGKELRKWRRPREDELERAAAGAAPADLDGLLKGVSRKRRALLERLHKHLSRMRSVNVNDWFASKGRQYGPREPFDVMDDFFDSSEAVVAAIARRDDLADITFHPDSCIVEFASIDKLYALLRDPDNRFYWWNIWQR